jgi:glycosyltransferase involved in cell wall biosynthesis
MNILYLAHRIPFPPDKGDKIRSIRELQRLARDHRVWCACFVDDANDVRHVGALKEYCEDVIAIRLHKRTAQMRGLLGLARGNTITESYYSHPAIRRALSAWSSFIDFDSVVAFSSSMAPYALDVPARRRVLDLCDLDSQKWLDYAARARGPARWFYETEGARLAARELEWIERFDATLLITQAEVEALSAPAAPGKVHVITNGVEIPPARSPELLSTSGRNSASRAAGFSPREFSSCEELRIANDPAYQIGSHSDRSRHSPPIVGFVGVMDYRPNIDAVTWFARTCWPGIRSKHPSAIFRIVGRRPTRRVLKLQKTPGIEVVGGVDDVDEEIRRFDVSVAPMRIARGLQNKVLEAMAAERAVVLTPEAAEGIAAVHNRHFIVTSEPFEMTKAICQLLSDATKRQQIGEAARRLVASDYNWDGEMDRFAMLATGCSEPISSTHPVPADLPVKLPAQTQNGVRTIF